MKEEIIKDLGEKYHEVIKNGVSPCLLIINEQFERLLFIEGVISKADSAEMFVKDNYGCELVVLKDHEVCFFGKEEAKFTL